MTCGETEESQFIFDNRSHIIYNNQILPPKNGGRIKAAEDYDLDGGFDVSRRPE